MQQTNVVTLGGKPYTSDNLINSNVEAKFKAFSEAVFSSEDEAFEKQIDSLCSELIGMAILVARHLDRKEAVGLAMEIGRLMHREAGQ